jgi:hypothetical protein
MDNFSRMETKLMRLETSRLGFSRSLLELLGEKLVSIARGPRIHINLPNLRCRDLSLHLIGDQLQVGVTVENVGLARAGACDVVAHIWLSATGQMYHLQTRWPALNAGSVHRLDLGTVQNVAPDQFANVTVIVDPPTAGRPGGEVWESNEEDNTCTSSIYTTPVPAPDPPSEDIGEPTEPLEPPIRDKK